MDVWLDRYLADLERDNASPNTIRNYGTDIGQFLDFCQGRAVTVADELTLDLVREHMEQLHGLDYVPASIARRVFELRAFGDFLVRRGAWSRNIFRRIYAPRVPQRLPRFLTLDEMQRLLDTPDTSTVRGLRDRAIMEVLYGAGVRVSELVGLDVEDVDLDRAELRVIGKGDKERIVLLGEYAVLAMRAYLAVRQADDGCTAVFVSRLGSRLSRRSVSTVVRQAGEAAGIAQAVTPHLLRHTFATHMLDGGAGLRVVQELLGHASVATTQVYANVTQGRVREVYLSAHPRSDGVTATV
jgi:site-specific recombinase XerD